jgi:N-formylglutamate deformylase
MTKTIPLIVSIPHSGEEVPPEATWLQNLPETTLMCDVDRYVDKLYEPALSQLQIPSVITKWHRYSGDLNRLPEDVDASTVLNNPNPKGKFSRGFLWAVTTTGIKLMQEPINEATHELLAKKYFQPFHDELKTKIASLREQNEIQNQNHIYHLDLHSMPAIGTSEHRDPGEKRADFVISDQNGKSSRSELMKIVTEAFTAQGFSTKKNWPYIGGRITEMYGRPTEGHHTIQVEMNRSLYMNETTKKYLPALGDALKDKLTHALKEVKANIAAL